MPEESNRYAIFVAAAVAVLMLAVPCAHGQQTTLHTEELLRAREIPLTADGLAAYLEREAIDGDGEMAVARLGSADPRERERAMDTLLKMDDPPLAALKKAVQSDDPEVRRRAQQTLGLLAERGLQKDAVNPALILESITEVIIRRKLKGCTPALLKRLNGVTDGHLTENVVLACRASVLKQDEDTLLKALESRIARIRYAALVSLIELDSPQLASRLGALVDDPDSMIRYHAALRLLNGGDLNGALALIGLLGDGDPVVRSRSVNCLRNATGKSFGFLPWQHPKNSKPMADAWLAWYKGLEKEPKFALPTSPIPRGKGHLFYNCFNHDHVYEVDADGNQVWKAKVPKITFQVMGLPMGHRLVLSDDYDNLAAPIFMEFDQEGKVIWQLERKDRQSWDGMGQLTHMQPLESGAIMASSDKIGEFSRSGELLTTITGPKTRCPNYFKYSTKLANGRYLGAMFLGESSGVGMVVELTPKGERIWSMTELKDPSCVLRKPNGNTVIFQFGAKRLSEFTPEGAEVWGLQIPCQNEYANLQNLENGEIFFSGGYQAMRIGETGTVISTRGLPGMWRAHLF